MFFKLTNLMEKGKIFFLFLSCNFSLLPTLETSLRHFLPQVARLTFLMFLSHKRSNTPAQKAEILVCYRRLKNLENSFLCQNHLEFRQLSCKTHTPPKKLLLFLKTEQLLLSLSLTAPFFPSHHQHPPTQTHTKIAD